MYKVSIDPLLWRVAEVVFHFLIIWFVTLNKLQKRLVVMIFSTIFSFTEKLFDLEQKKKKNGGIYK